MEPAVPMIEISTERNLLGRGSPHRECDALCAVDRTEVRAKFVVYPVLVAFVEQVKVLWSQRWQKGIRIKKLPHLSRRRRDAELIPEDLRTFRNEDFEDAIIGNRSHRPVL